MPLLSTRINLNAIAHNVSALKEHVGADVQLMCVVKADAYGHGVVDVARVMERSGADAFGVATIGEATALRDAGINAPILAWLWNNDVEPGSVSSALAANVELAIPSLEQARFLVDSKIPGKVCVKVETGMHRNGIDRADWDEVFALLASEEATHLEVTGVMGHLACADEPGNEHNALQGAQLRAAIDCARSHGLNVPVNHLAASGGAIAREDLRFEQVRVGVACYGLSPFDEESGGVALRPAMTWAATVLNVKPVAAGEATSYGLTWRAEEAGYLAVVSVGYADGLPRAVQGAFDVTIGGKRYPQVGRVCMDQIVVSLGANEFGVATGDEVIVFGEGGVSASEVARAVGTINYEVVCWPGGRTRRVVEGAVE